MGTSLQSFLKRHDVVIGRKINFVPREIQRFLSRGFQRPRRLISRGPLSRFLLEISSRDIQRFSSRGIQRCRRLMSRAPFGRFLYRFTPGTFSVFLPGSFSVFARDIKRFRSPGTFSAPGGLSPGGFIPNQESSTVRKTGSR